MLEPEVSKFDGDSTVTVSPLDSLDDVPASHREQITDEVVTWFQKPFYYIQQIAQRAPTPTMKQWAQRIIAEGEWKLQLINDRKEQKHAAFWFGYEGGGGFHVTPPAQDQDTSHLPSCMDQFYQCGNFCWGGIPYPGSFYDPSGIRSVADRLNGIEPHGDKFEPEQTFTYGCYDDCTELIFTSDGRGGTFDWETHEVKLPYTIEEQIDLIFQERL